MFAGFGCAIFGEEIMVFDPKSRLPSNKSTTLMPVKSCWAVVFISVKVGVGLALRRTIENLRTKRVESMTVSSRF